MRKSKHLNILVIEDDSNIRFTTQTILESEGYSVSLAVHGRDGLETLRNMEPPCLVLLDINMPEMDGYEFLLEKNADPTIASVPVVVVSATAEVSRLGGVAEVVKKPFALEDLIATVGRFCGG